MSLHAIHRWHPGCSIVPRDASDALYLRRDLSGFLLAAWRSHPLHQRRHTRYLAARRDHHHAVRRLRRGHCLHDQVVASVPRLNPPLNPLGRAVGSCRAHGGRAPAMRSKTGLCRRLFIAVGGLVVREPARWSGPLPVGSVELDASVGLAVAVAGPVPRLVIQGEPPRGILPERAEALLVLVEDPDVTDRLRGRGGRTRPGSEEKRDFDAAPDRCTSRARCGPAFATSSRNCSTLLTGVPLSDRIRSPGWIPAAAADCSRHPRAIPPLARSPSALQG
jgi:hypothetical protein